MPSRFSAQRSNAIPGLPSWRSSVPVIASAISAARQAPVGGAREPFVFLGKFLLPRGLFDLLAEELVYGLADHGPHDLEEDRPTPARMPPHLVEGRLRG
jgi:hypothetical protein